MALIGKAYNPFGMGSGGSGLASGFKYAQGLKDRETFAQGLSEYMNATNDAQKVGGLQKMASVDGQNAVRLMDNSLQRELANRQLAQKQAEFDWAKEKFGQMTPYQQADVDLRKQMYEANRENTEYTRSKDAETKERERQLGEALYRVQTAQTDEEKNSAWAEVYRVSPEFAKDILKKQKEAEKKGYGNSELGLMIDVQMNPENYSPEVVQYVKDYGRVKIKDPYLRGVNEYEGTVGKQYAEAGLPYGNYGQAEQMPVQKPMPSTFGGYMDTQPQQMQEMPMQAQPIPTAAQLARDKKIEEEKVSLEFSPQKKAADEKAKYEAEITQKRENLNRNIQSLREMTDELIALADKATYTQIGQWRDSFLRQAGLPMSEGGIAREKYNQIVRNELLPKLRETFGGQLSDGERQALLSTLGDVNLSPPEKKAAISAFMESKERQLKSYYDNGSSLPQEENVISADEWFKQ